MPLGNSGGAPSTRGMESQWSDLVRHAVEGTVVVDGDGIVVFANPAAEALLGSAPGCGVGIVLGYPAVGAEPTVVTFRRPGADPATVELRAAETLWDGTAAFVVNLHDITERKQAEDVGRRLQAQSDHLNQVLRTIAKVHQILIRESDTERLIQSVCRGMVASGDFLASWIALTDEDGTLVSAAESGIPVEDFAALVAQFDRGAVPECCRRACEEERLVITRPEGGCGGCEVCAGLASGHNALTSCLMHGERLLGYLTVVTDVQAGGESGEEARLIQTIAGDIAFALYSIGMAGAQERTQRLLEEIERVAGVGGWEWDLESDRFTVSEGWQEIHGCDRQQLRSSDILSLSAPEDRRRWAVTLEALRDSGDLIELDHRIVRQDTGETRVLRSRGGSVEQGAGGKRIARGIAQDITVNHAATERIRFQARVLAAVGEAVIVTDPQGTIIFWNDAAERLYGWSSQEVLGRSVMDVTPSPGMSEAAQEIMERLASGETWSGEFTVRDRDGRRFPVHVTDAPIFGDGGELEAIIGVSSDLTERVRAEKALREASTRLGAAVAGGQVGLWAWNLTNDVVAYSSEWKRQIGCHDDEIGDGLDEWRSRVHPEDIEETLREVESCRTGGQNAYRAEFRFRHKDGSYRSILSQASIERDEAGLPARMLGSHVDITELRQAEANHRNMEAQLHQSQKMESVGRLAGGVAHDFNNVLGVILGISELSLLNEDLPELLRGDFREIHQAGTRAASLTRQLLAFARQQTIQPQVVDLNETVASMMKMLSRLIGEDLELIWNPGHELWSVKVDPAQVDQILANLTVNARDAIQDGGEGDGRISLRTANVELDQAFCDRYRAALPGQYVVLSVSDNGMGMDKATLANAFEPFFTTKASGKGTGLGLATVYGIVKQNEGFVDVYSEVGEGTTIRVYLPRLVGPDAEPEAQSKALEIAQASETLLVVEDDAAVLSVVSRILKMLGYNLLVAETPKNALELVREHGETIDLLMTDVVMPGMNGRELSEAVLALRPEIKCLFVSGYTQDIIAHKGVLPEGMHFLEKPFTAESLATAVRRALEDPKVGDSSPH